MAEGILFDLAGKVLEGLGSLAAEELGAALGLKEEMKKLARTGSAIRAVLRDAEDQRNRNNHQRSEEIIGRDDDKNKIVRLLLKSEPEQHVSIVPIIGIGGLGKTTLAKMVFNDEKLGDHFELKMWVCVSEKFELKVIVEKVIEAATKTKPEKGPSAGNTATSSSRQ
ncbi:hypothetical protein Gotur_020089, partial [Gossypium turneri]